ncbi:LOW QUALITY PROTEIN: myeloid cell surface antigen CD33-like [Apodemus sylvaticus]|uniref:LOW QUALITY PROTEIN: myeloid cell surface antigen CD33-like n=1 Tax=Apodemus sylvaticus TaxID=10129 RepID=UPI002241E101|nr:LOW QUALITY PROTEIN: myeloid cell surface antigen CD33-like [Apodemus sylvaticus]
MLLPQLLPLLWVIKWASGDCITLPREFRGTYPFLTMEYPSLSYELQSVTVQEGLCVLVPCTVTEYPMNSDLVFGYWFHEGENTDRDSPVATNNPSQLVQKETQSRFHLSGYLRLNHCSLDIRDAQKGDNGSYFFRLEKEGVKWNFCEDRIFVHVTALTHTPNISIPQTLELGRPTDVMCSVPWACERGTPPIFSWMSAALISLGPTTAFSSVLTLTPRLQDHGTNLTCQVTFPGAGVTVRNTVQINVIYTPQNSTIHVSGRAGPGKSGPLAEVVQVAMGEAALKFLLLGICFLFLSMGPHKKRVRRPAIYTVHADTVMD